MAIRRTCSDPIGIEDQMFTIKTSGAAHATYHADCYGRTIRARHTDTPANEPDVDASFPRAEGPSDPTGTS